MFMYMHLKQLLRKPVRTIQYVFVLALLTAFFCTSLNLYRNSEYNLKLADDAFTTIAVMELYADVDSAGQIVEDILDDDYAGYHAVTVYNYDLTPIVNAPSVIKYDLRARYGAFSEDNVSLRSDKRAPKYPYDVIRFKITSDDNLIKRPDGTYSYDNEELIKNDKFYIQTAYELGVVYSSRGRYKLDILDDAVGLFSYRYKLNSKYENDSKIILNIELGNYTKDGMISYDAALSKLYYDESYIYLEPDTEYIAIVDASYDDKKDESGKYKVSGITFWRDFLYGEYAYLYGMNTRYGTERCLVYGTNEQPFWLQKYEEVKKSPELLEKFKNIGRAYYINARSFGIMTTNDVAGIPAFNLGNMYIKDGRVISEEEYCSGSKVCMISKEMAKAQNWHVGSKIDFNFYEYNFFTNATGHGAQLKPFYTFTSPDHFFDSGEYEVVGIYDVRPMTGSSTISEAAISVPWNTIYIPEKSLENAPAEEDRPVTGALLTIWLENGKIEPFIERMNELGITGAKQGDYEARFTFYDQGYSRIQPSLEALSGTAELLLILSSSLLVIAALLLAFFYAQSQKQSIGTMRLLGCSKARAFAAVMLSALIIAVTGALIGAAIGHALTAGVGESIMANANQTPEEFRAFSAYLAESTQVEVEFALGADAKVSLLTCLAALGLFIAGTLVFVLRYLGKGPRELLPRAGE